MNLENLSEISKKNIFEIRDSESYKNSLSKFKFKKHRTFYGYKIFSPYLLMLLELEKKEHTKYKFFFEAFVKGHNYGVLLFEKEFSKEMLEKNIKNVEKLHLRHYHGSDSNGIGVICDWASVSKSIFKPISSRKIEEKAIVNGLVCGLYELIKKNKNLLPKKLFGDFWKCNGDIIGN